MATFREQDALTALIQREQARVLDCLMRFANGEGAGALAEVRRILRALADAQTEVLYPAFSRARLRLETQRLLDDSRCDRAEQLAALDGLAQRRATRLRKLAAVKLIDLIRHDDERLISLLLPVLMSQLPRPLYRSITYAFIAHYEGNLEHRANGAQRQRANA